ncbi:hypothetical protein [Xanthobacter sp. AM33]|uniref:hypothetical protein n=1 Tax=Xanthobacter TaxID=279 RepID=UPI0039BF03E7
MVKVLDAEGVRIRKGHSFGVGATAQILNNRTYLGEPVWQNGKTMRPEIENAAPQTGPETGAGTARRGSPPEQALG